MESSSPALPGRRRRRVPVACVDAGCRFAPEVAEITSTTRTEPYHNAGGIRLPRYSIYPHCTDESFRIRRDGRMNSHALTVDFAGFQLLVRDYWSVVDVWEGAKPVWLDN
jgi:hypothetical protein